MPDGDQGRWLSYQELAEVLGCTANAARMHAVRRKWPRRASNRIGERAHVLVPESVIVRPRAMHAIELRDAQCNAPVPANGRAPFDAHDMLQTICETIEAAVEPLREQLEHERRRADGAVMAELIAREQLAKAEQRADDAVARANRAEQRADEAIVRAERAEQRVDELLARQATADSPVPVPAAPDSPTASPAPAQRRRWWRFGR